MTERTSAPLSDTPKPVGQFVVFRRWSHGKQAKTSAVHPTLESAQDEAIRLALLEPTRNADFFISHVIGAVRMKDGKLLTE